MLQLIIAFRRFTEIDHGRPGKFPAKLASVKLRLADLSVTTDKNDGHETQRILQKRTQLVSITDLESGESSAQPLNTNA